MPSFIVTADIQYVDGPLAGLVISEGYRVSHADPAVVRKTAGWINGCHRRGESVKATGTGRRYQFTSNAQTVEAR